VRLPVLKLGCSSSRSSNSDFPLISRLFYSIVTLVPIIGQPLFPGFFPDLPARRKAGNEIPPVAV
jgi:hypothetical protein